MPLLRKKARALGIVCVCVSVGERGRRGIKKEASTYLEIELEEEALKMHLSP